MTFLTLISCGLVGTSIGLIYGIFAVGTALATLSQKAGVEIHKDKIAVSTSFTRFGTVHFEHDGSAWGVLKAFRRAYDYIMLEEGR